MSVLVCGRLFLENYNWQDVLLRVPVVAGILMPISCKLYLWSCISISLKINTFDKNSIVWVVLHRKWRATVTWKGLNQELWLKIDTAATCSGSWKRDLIGHTAHGAKLQTSFKSIPPCLFYCWQVQIIQILLCRKHKAIKRLGFVKPVGPFLSAGSMTST